MTKDILYTPEEVALTLKITKGTVYEMIKRGDLSAHRIGKHLRISESQLSEYLLNTSGNNNVYEGEIQKEGEDKYIVSNDVKIYVESPLEGQVKISIRPEHILLSKGEFLSSARNSFKGRVTSVQNLDNKVLVSMDIGCPIKITITPQSAVALKVIEGEIFHVTFKTLSVIVYKR